MANKTTSAELQLALVDIDGTVLVRVSKQISGNWQNFYVTFDDLASFVGGGGTQTLEQTLVLGNTTGGEDISISNGDKIVLDNGSELRKGTYDFGGTGGISRICSVGYEDMWQSGIHHIFDNNGFIRESNNCFNIYPDNTFDNTLRFKVGSRWVLDDGTTYMCTDASTGVAVWVDVSYLKLDGSNSPISDIDWGNNHLSNVKSTPSFNIADSDSVSKLLNNLQIFPSQSTGLVDCLTTGVYPLFTSDLYDNFIPLGIICYGVNVVPSGLTTSPTIRMGNNGTNNNLVPAMAMTIQTNIGLQTITKNPIYMIDCVANPVNVEVVTAGLGFTSCDINVMMFGIPF